MPDEMALTMPASPTVSPARPHRLPASDRPAGSGPVDVGELIGLNVGRGDPGSGKGSKRRW